MKKFLPIILCIIGLSVSDVFAQKVFQSSESGFSLYRIIY